MLVTGDGIRFLTVDYFTIVVRARAKPVGTYFTSELDEGGYRLNSYVIDGPVPFAHMTFTYPCSAPIASLAEAAWLNDVVNQKMKGFSMASSRRQYKYSGAKNNHSVLSHSASFPPNRVTPPPIHLTFPCDVPTAHVTDPSRLLCSLSPLPSDAVYSGGSWR